MKKHTLVALAGAAAAALLAVPFAGSANPERRVVITERMQLTGPSTQAGTFAAAGAVNDAGAASATFTVTPRKHNTGELRGTHVLQGSKGTITLATRARVYPFPPPAAEPRALAEGRWQITAGTGAYAGLKGRGKVYATADFTTGQITIARLGKVKRP